MKPIIKEIESLLEIARGDAGNPENESHGMAEASGMALAYQHVVNLLSGIDTQIVWSDDDENGYRKTGRTPFRIYSVYLTIGGKWDVSGFYGDTYDIPLFDTVEEAMAVCQADYDKKWEEALKFKKQPI